MDWGIANLFCGLAMIKLNQKVTLRHLQALVTLADTNSFSRAADALAVTQPALSASIKQLENQLGTRLFDRTTHQISLTAQGSVVLEYARHLLNTASNIFDDIEHAIGTGRHRIRVGAIPSAVTLTAAVIARYNQAHDEHVEILLQDMPNDALLDALHSGKLDFCVGIKPPDSLSSQTLETVTLFEDELVLIVSRRHPLSGQGGAVAADGGGRDRAFHPGQRMGICFRSADAARAGVLTALSGRAQRITLRRGALGHCHRHHAQPLHHVSAR